MLWVPNVNPCRVSLWPVTYTLTQKYNTKATFFITGRNFGKGAINDPAKPWRALIKRMFDEGHQVASHTWSHQNLATIKQETFRQQMLWNEVAIADILDGRFPTYMRPPYSSSNGQTDAWLGELGYHVVYFDLDTEATCTSRPRRFRCPRTSGIDRQGPEPRQQYVARH